MKSFRILLLTVVLAVFSGIITAAPTSREDALQKARQFYSDKVEKGLRGGTDFQLVYSDTGRVANNQGKEEFVCFYIFNANDEGGFVIVSGDDAVKPIIGYSDEGSFPTGQIPENVRSWLNNYSKEIQYIVANNSLNNSSNTQVDKNGGLRSANSVVGPLLGNIRWNQDDPFNLLCPSGKKSSEKTVTGCVATAMAQLMKYHNWPVRGSGSNSYTFVLDSDSTTLSADFGQTTYNWGSMLDDYNGSTNSSKDSAVALLMYHCGVAVEMNYQTSQNGGSSASMVNAGIALKTNFGYDYDLQMYRRAYFDLTTWKAKLINEINSGRPVLYAGVADDAGHAFLCDGYDSEGFFHFNWGWGGHANGYFSVSILDPDYAGIGSSSGGYTNGQYAIMGIQKPDGVNNTTYQLNMYNQGLVSNKPSIANIGTETFNLSSGFVNYGLNSFTCEAAPGLYKDGVFQKYLSKVSVPNLATYQGTSSFTFTNLSLKNLSSGSYRIYLVFLPTGKSTWQIVASNYSLNNYVDVVINGTAATIKSPSVKPNLNLSSSIQTIGKIYRNKTGRFTIPIMNDGIEFYSYLSLYIYSASNPSSFQYLKNGLAVIKNGEVESVQLSGSITLAPGSYNAYAVYDSTNNFSKTSFKKVGQSSYTPLQFTIYSDPAAPAMTLNKKISIDGGNTIYKYKNISIDAEIKNTGGFYDNQILAFIFRPTGGTSVGSLTPQTIYIDNNETKTYTVTGSTNLDPGQYKILLYYNLSGWKRFDTSDNATVNVTLLDNPVAIENINTERLKLNSTFVNDKIDIITNEGVIKVDIFDFNGRRLESFANLSTLPVGDLKKGFYLLKVITDKGIYNLRFIKQ